MEAISVDEPDIIELLGEQSAPRAISALADGVFICGRQHSGNTMLAALMGRFDRFVATQDEEIFFECRSRLERMRSAVERAKWISQHLNLKKPELEQRVSEQLLAWARAHPRAGALEVFQKATALSTVALGKRAWARKATSYIFHADEILREMPNVRMIYLLRNPFDLAASIKRRDPSREHIVGTALSWNRGAELATHFEQRHPSRMHLVRYEKLVTVPEEKVKRLCKFLDESFTPQLLEVPQINSSDNPYELLNDKKGMSQEHLYYYMDVLSDAEIVAIQLLTSRTLLRRLYPDLPHFKRSYPTSAWMKALLLIAGGVFRYPVQVTRHSMRNRYPLRDYLLRRVRVMMGFKEPSKGEQIRGQWVARPAIAGMIAALLGVIYALASIGISRVSSFFIN